MAIKLPLNMVSRPLFRGTDSRHPFNPGFMIPRIPALEVQD
jgi:hypothetical protein